MAIMVSVEERIVAADAKKRARVTKRKEKTRPITLDANVNDRDTMKLATKAHALFASSPSHSSPEIN